MILFEYNTSNNPSNSLNRPCLKLQMIYHNLLSNMLVSFTDIFITTLKKMKVISQYFVFFLGVQ